MSKISKDKRDKIILIGIGTAVVCAAIGFFLISAQRTRLSGVLSETAKSREQVAGGQRTLKSQAEVKQEFESASAALRQRESAMASPNDMYLWQIETLNSFRTGYKVEIPQFGREQPGEVGCFPNFPYRAALFKVSGSAHFHEFGKFLAGFENAFPYIRVQNIDLEPGSGESGEAREKLNFRMDLLTLIRPNAL